MIKPGCRPAIILLFTFSFATAQQRPDSLSAANAILKGKWDLAARTVLMGTVNEGAPKDDYAWAAGAAVGYTTKKFYRFQARASGGIIYNLLSSDLAAPDPVTLMPNRYESGLFDVTRPATKYNLLRAEELWLRYAFSRGTATIGRMRLKTPFLNPQDGRMNTTMEEGIWVSSAEGKKVQVNAGWLWAISPRSSTRWYSVARSVGVYNSGVNADGTPSDYAGNLSSSGIALTNVIINPTGSVKILLWDMLVDNIMNSAMIEVRHQYGKKLNWFQGLMYIRQDAINNGGNPDRNKTYMLRGDQSNTISAQAGVKNDRFSSSLDLTWITGDGRYLAPREWGSDPLYTFMAREKNDGSGNVLAATVHSFLKVKPGINTGVSAGYFRMPDVLDHRLNKYGIPSYYHFSCFVQYEFSGRFQGLKILLLPVLKVNQGATYGNPEYVYNKVNLLHVGLFVDYKL